MGRKSHGILVAVSPCLHIISIRPMFSSESLAQIFLLVHQLLRMIPDLSHIIYDNACGAARSLRKRLSSLRSGTQPAQSWAKLHALHWVIDRLHLRYHTACRQPHGSWHVPGVDPAEHPRLHGVDTEAAEQIFLMLPRNGKIFSHFRHLSTKSFSCSCLLARTISDKSVVRPGVVIA